MDQLDDNGPIILGSSSVGSSLRSSRQRSRAMSSTSANKDAVSSRAPGSSSSKVGQNSKTVTRPGPSRQSPSVIRPRTKKGRLDKARNTPVTVMVTRSKSSSSHKQAQASAAAMSGAESTASGINATAGRNEKSAKPCQRKKTRTYPVASRTRSRSGSSGMTRSKTRSVGVAGTYTPSRKVQSKEKTTTQRPATSRAGTTETSGASNDNAAARKPRPARSDKSCRVMKSGTKRKSTATSSRRQTALGRNANSRGATRSKASVEDADQVIETITISDSSATDNEGTTDQRPFETVYINEVYSPEDNTASNPEPSRHILASSGSDHFERRTNAFVDLSFPSAPVSNQEDYILGLSTQIVEDSSLELSDVEDAIMEDSDVNVRTGVPATASLVVQDSVILSDEELIPLEDSSNYVDTGADSDDDTDDDTDDDDVIILSDDSPIRNNNVRNETCAVGSNGNAINSPEPGCSTDRWSCPICASYLSELKKEEIGVVSTICGHIFCGRCIKQISDEKKFFDCPNCRKLLSRKSVHPLFL